MRGARAVLHRSVQRVPGQRSPRSSASRPRCSRGRTCASRLEHGRIEHGPPAALPQHVPAVHGDDADRAHHQQHGPAVGRDGGRDALDGAARHAVPHARQPGGRLEVLHPVRRRHRAGACSARSCCTSRRRRCSAREGVDALLWTHLDAVKGQLEPAVIWASRSSSCWSATAPRWAWRRCTTGCPTRTPRARRRSRRCSRACC